MKIKGELRGAREMEDEKTLDQGCPAAVKREARGMRLWAIKRSFNNKVGYNLITMGSGDQVANGNFDLSAKDVIEICAVLKSNNWAGCRY